MIDQLYRTMRTIRLFEERVVDLVNANEIAGVTHEYVGQEAVATGVCAALRPDDVITSTHRGHGHVIAKGADVRRMMAELLGRVDGLNRGRGGSMHIADVSAGVLGANGIVGAGTPHAAGAAWAFKVASEDRVAASFFGEGGMNQGVLLETLNLAAIWELPVVFVCENNRYAVTMASERATAGSILDRVAAYGIPAESVDGMDAEAVYAVALEARGRAGPSFLECRTYRFFGHHTAERTMRLGYRTDEEIAEWRLRDPLEVTGSKLTADARGRIDREVADLVDEAVEYARASPRPDADEALDYVWAGAGRPRPGVAAKAP